MCGSVSTHLLLELLQRSGRRAARSLRRLARKTDRARWTAQLGLRRFPQELWNSPASGEAAQAGACPPSRGEGLRQGDRSLELRGAGSGSVCHRSGRRREQVEFHRQGREGLQQVAPERALLSEGEQARGGAAQSSVWAVLGTPFDASMPPAAQMASPPRRSSEAAGRAGLQLRGGRAPPRPPMVRPCSQADSSRAIELEVVEGMAIAAQLQSGPSRACRPIAPSSSGQQGGAVACHRVWAGAPAVPGLRLVARQGSAAGSSQQVVFDDLAEVLRERGKRQVGGDAASSTAAVSPSRELVGQC